MLSTQAVPTVLNLNAGDLVKLQSASGVHARVELNRGLPLSPHAPRSDRFIDQS